MSRSWPTTRSPARRPPPPASTAGSRSRTAAAPGSTTPTLAFARLSPGVDFGAKDGPADLAFLIAAPAGGDASHLKLLAKLARALVKKEFTDSLRAATTPAEVVELVSGVVGDERPARPHPLPPPQQLPRPRSSRKRTTVRSWP